jgi:hypothetical protein
MAHYAKIEDGVVTQVIVAHSKLWCEETLGGTWVQTSYNTQGNQHLLGGTPLNKNYAGIGYLWDGTGFHSPACHDEATLDPDTYLWDCANADHDVKPAIEGVN